eukprot:jgi/Hompol1/5058/HPOL_004125-RA
MLDDGFSDRIQYPLFWRISSSFALFFDAFATFAKYFAWKAIGVVYSEVSANKDWAHGFSAGLPSRGIQVETIVGIPDYVSPGPYINQLRKPFDLLKATQLRVFLVIADPEPLMDIMLAASAMGLIDTRH